MRTTKEVISIIQDYMDEVPVDRVRSYLSRAYLKLINSNSPQNVFYLNETQPLPILNTTTDNRRYALDETNLVDSDGVAITMEQFGITVTARKLRSLFIENTNYTSNYLLDPYEPIGYPTVYNTWYESKRFSRIPCQPYNQRGNNAATVLLLDDYDTDIYVEFYYTPGDLLTNNDVMLIDTDEWTDALVDGAVGYYEDLVNGRSDRLAKFQTYWVRSYLNKGVDNLMHKIPNSFKARKIG